MDSEWKLKSFPPIIDDTLLAVARHTTDRVRPQEMREGRVQVRKVGGRHVGVGGREKGEVHTSRSGCPKGCPELHRDPLRTFRASTPYLNK